MAEALPARRDAWLRANDRRTVSHYIRSDGRHAVHLSWQHDPGATPETGLICSVAPSFEGALEDAFRVFAESYASAMPNPST